MLVGLNLQQMEVLKGVVAHPSTLKRCALQRAAIAIGEMAIPCYIHALRFFINTPS